MFQPVAPPAPVVEQQEDDESEDDDWSPDQDNQQSSSSSSSSSGESEGEDGSEEEDVGMTAVVVDEEEFGESGRTQATNENVGHAENENVTQQTSIKVDDATQQMPLMDEQPTQLSVNESDHVSTLPLLDERPTQLSESQVLSSSMSDEENKKPRNAQFRAMLEREAEQARRTKKSRFLENEAEEEEEDDQVGVYTYKEKIIGQKEEEEEDEAKLRVTEDDLKHIVDTNSDDEGDKEAPKELFNQQLEEKDEQMLKRVQKDLENHTFLNRRRKLLASGLERALNGADDSDEETDEEMELAREKRFEEEMKKRLKEASQVDGTRRRVLLGETKEDIELELEQTKKFFEMSKKMKKSSSSLAPITSQQASWSSSLPLDETEDSKTVLESLLRSSSSCDRIDNSSSLPGLFTNTSSLPGLFNKKKPALHASSSVLRSSSMTTSFVYTKRVKVEEEEPDQELMEDETVAKSAFPTGKPSRNMPARVIAPSKRRVNIVPVNQLPTAKLFSLTSLVQPGVVRNKTM